jgi:FlaA1/EpsC-like NDP-sugar epimerase
MSSSLEPILSWAKIFISWTLGAYFALYFRFETDIPDSALSIFPATVVFFLLIFLAISEADRLLFGRFESLTFEEFFSLTRRFIFTGAVTAFILSYFNSFNLPRSYPVLTSILSLGTQLALEKLSRFVKQQSNFSNRKVPIAIYGGGEQGKLLVQKILKDSTTSWYPKVIIDDNLNKSIKRINGIKLEPGDNLEFIINKYKISVLIVSFTKISGAKLQEIKSLCDKLKVELQIIPPIKAITGKDFSLLDIRAPSTEELIGKLSINLDLDEVKRLIINKTVLITGAGGSIGSELARQVVNFSPKKLYLLDRDESALLQVNLSISNQGSLEQDQLILADIRDVGKVKQVLQNVKPDLVFHAAALKHLSLLENFPEEAVKTNIVGTLNLLKESVDSKVSVFVNISTDKAADPISVLGKSKLYAEQATTFFGQENPEFRYFSVRFGNVFGSRGSVLHTFDQQIKSGGPVTITARGVTRFFMTIEDAVHLVLKAATRAKTGETLILNMGNSILIEKIAKKLIESSGKTIEITYGKLRKGEKLHEQLIGIKEKIMGSSDSEIFTIESSPNDLNFKDLMFEDFLNLIKFSRS